MQFAFFKRFFSFFLAGLSALLVYLNIGPAPNPTDGISGIYFDGISSIRDVGYTLKSYKNLIGNDGISTDFVCKDERFSVMAGGVRIPVYTVPLYSGQQGGGTLHSFCYIDSNCTENYTVKIDTGVLLTPAIFPAIDFYQGLNFVSFTVEPGEECVYTFFENKFSDAHVLTIRIFNGQSEEAQIERYVSAFGKEQVTVLEKGIHEAEQFSLPSNGVLYLKSGAYLKIKHSDKSGGAIRAENFENIVLDGKGILDCSNLSWHERNGMEFMFGRSLTIHNITVLNSANWSCYLYNVSDADLSGITVLGSRQNGDGIDVCNSRNVRVSNCFVRAGDDCFNVKTLGNSEDTPCEDVTFTHNVAWATKARAAGLTGEINCDIRNIVFDDLTVIRCDAEWNDKRIGALAIVQEEGSGNVENVTFRNIRIADAQCPPVLLSVLGDRTDVKMQGICFENIDYNSRKKISVYRRSALNQIECSLRQITKNGRPISARNVYCDIAENSALRWTI